MSSPRPVAKSPETPAKRRVPGEVLGFILSLIWLGMLVTAFVVLNRQGMELSDTLGLVVVALAVFLPIALIWFAVLVLSATRQMRNEAARIETSVETLRREQVRSLHAPAPVQAAPEAAGPDAQPDEAQREVEDKIALFTTRRDPSRPLELGRPETGTAADDPQPVLALENPLPADRPLGIDDFIRALNFPETDRDEAGFTALRRALEDHRSAELVRAAQDVLTGLAAEGVFMDDLSPDRARPEIWRQFALGARGEEIAALGGVRDRSVLALTYGRMRANEEFRDASHRFLRAFDRRFTAFEAGATDGEISRFAETRSARAFMLLGRVTGIFG